MLDISIQLKRRAINDGRIRGGKGPAKELQGL